jgi:ABC-type amino acid transport substrate-binding protein
MVWRGTAALVFALVCNAASADVLERVSETKTFRLGYRTDAPPFSMEGPQGNRQGYSVDLCRAVADTVRSELKLSALVVQYIAVDAENRFEKIEDGSIDILCGPTTATLSRRERVDFSLPTFIAGAGVMVPAGAGIVKLDDLADKRLGVRAGTTTEQALMDTYPDASIVATTDHRNGLAGVLNGSLDAYFADRTVLEGLRQEHRDAARLKIADDYLTIEPYGLALPKDDSRFRLLVDRTLSTLYKSRQIEEIAARHFDGQLSDLLHTLYQITPLPE